MLAAAMAAPHALDLRPAAALRPPRRLPALADCLVLAALLHLLAVAVFGSAPGGTAQLGQSVWGAINVRLAGTGPAGPETAPPPEVVTGPPGTAATQRWGGAVRDSSAPTPAAQPGAARLGTWNPARTAAKADTLPPAASPGPAAAIPAPAPAPAPVPALVQDPAPAPPAEPGPPPALGALRATAQPLQPLAPLPAVAAPVPATATPAPPAVPALAPLPAPATRALAPMPTAVPATAAPLLQVPQPLATARPLAAPPQAPVLRELPAAAPTTAPTTATPDTAPPAPAPDPAATPAPAAPQAVPLAPSPTGVPMAQPVPAAGTTRQGLPQRPAFGAPDAGAAVGTDVATPPAAAASQPRLNLDYVRPRGGEISTLGRRGVVNALPVPPDVKDKLAEDIAKSAREDCRKAYAGGGLAAVVPLAVDALRKDGCRW